MRDQPNETVEEQGRRTEQAILVLVLSGGQSVWSVEELVKIGRRLDVIDSLAALQAAGLVHRCHDFVFATRAASRFDEIDL